MAPFEIGAFSCAMPQLSTDRNPNLWLPSWNGTGPGDNMDSLFAFQQHLSGPSLHKIQHSRNDPLFFASSSNKNISFLDLSEIVEHRHKQHKTHIQTSTAGRHLHKHLPPALTGEQTPITQTCPSLTITQGNLTHAATRSNQSPCRHQNMPASYLTTFIAATTSHNA